MREQQQQQQLPAVMPWVAAHCLYVMCMYNMARGVSAPEGWIDRQSSDRDPRTFGGSSPAAPHNPRRGRPLRGEEVALLRQQPGHAAISSLVGVVGSHSCSSAAAGE